MPTRPPRNITVRWRRRATGRASLRARLRRRLRDRLSKRTRRRLRVLRERRARLRATLVRAARRHLRTVYYRFQLLLPIQEDLAVYAAYWYRGYACNPRAIYEKAAELVPGVRGVWVVRRKAAGTLPPGVDHVVAGSLAYLRLLARAKYFVNNCNFPGFVVKRPGTVHLMTQHGTPLKAMGLDLRDRPAGAGTDFDALLARTGRYDLMVSANPLSSRVWRRGFPGPYELLEIGHPRNDRLVNATGEEVVRLRTELGVPLRATALLYAPTHRDDSRAFEPALDIARLLRGLGPEYVLLVRAHYFNSARGLSARHGLPAGQVIDVSAHPSVEELCLAADMLITDYSSIMFDYANLDRPIVVHAPDWAAYRAYRGVYFELLDDPPGPVATSTDDLIDIVRSGAAGSAEAARCRAEYRRRYCPWDDGYAAERAVRRLFGLPPRPEPGPPDAVEAGGAPLAADPYAVAEEAVAAGAPATADAASAAVEPVAGAPAAEEPVAGAPVAAVPAAVAPDAAGEPGTEQPDAGRPPVAPRPGGGR